MDSALASAFDRVAADALAATDEDERVTFEIDDRGVISFPRDRVFFGQFGVVPAALSAQHPLSADAAIFVDRAQAAEAQGRAGEARALYERIRTNAELAPWASLRLAILDVEAGDRSRLSAVADAGRLTGSTCCSPAIGAAPLGLWAQAFTERRPQGPPELVKPVTRSGALYIGVDLNSQDIDMVSMDLATGKQTSAPVRLIQRATGSNGQPTWSPDGKSLAYHSRRTGAIGIRSMDTGEINELQPRPSLAYFQGLSWAPDGQSFAVFGGDLKGRDDMFRIDARSGEVTPIAVPIA